MHMLPAVIACMKKLKTYCAKACTCTILSRDLSCYFQVAFMQMLPGLRLHVRKYWERACTCTGMPF